LLLLQHFELLLVRRGISGHVELGFIELLQEIKWE
jgi:hypothetical protein